MKGHLNAGFLRAVVAVGVFAVFVIGLVVVPRRVRAHDEDEDEDQAKVRIGIQIAPVKLNLKGKDRDLVGLGSYIVNAQGDCDGCHSRTTEFAAPGIPFFGQHPTKVNPDGYLAGGQDFGALDSQGLSFHIIVRNLTPDKTGRPEGGATFDEFLQRMRHGTDLDKFHPTCTDGLNPTCVPPPFDGSVLQIMPWPIYANMTRHDLRAIYEYLSAIRCVEGDPGNPKGSDTGNERCEHND
jgi:hypothetical protein